MQNKEIQKLIGTLINEQLVYDDMGKAKLTKGFRQKIEEAMKKRIYSTLPLVSIGS